MAKSRAIRQRVFIQAPPGKVFKSLTEPRGLRRWLLASGKLSPRKGGTYRFAWEGGYSHSGKVLDYVRDKRLSLSWPMIQDGKLLGSTRVTFRLKPRDKGAVLDMTHAGFKSGEQWVRMFGSYSGGWGYFLTNLKSVLQHGRDLRSPLDNI